MDEAILKQSKILIVDDQQANVFVLQDYLEIQGFENIMTTTDSREVAQLFISFKPDIILLDLRMPHLSGFQVMAQLKLLVPKDTYLPILILTADITPEAKKKALSEGAKDFLIKPFDLTEVSLRINNLLLTNHLMKELQNQNAILEEKVKERTAELEEKNTVLIEAKEKAEASNRLKSAFLATMNHELRTPLNHLLGFSSLIYDMTEDETIKDFSNTMLTSGHNLLRIIEDIFEVAQLEQSQVTIRKQYLMLSDLFATLKEQLQETLIKSNKHEQINLFFNYESDLLSKQIFSDKLKLTQVLSNLINNAVKFTEKGTISLSISYSLLRNLEISIKDTGVGIPLDKQEIIFEMFRQADDSHTRRFEGIGIGLFIAQKIAQLLHGNIIVKSEPDNGTEFTFSLPVDISEGENPIELTYERTTPDLSDKSILIVEDDEVNLELMSRIIKQTNALIYKSINGVEAVETAQNNKIDLILMDLKMPIMDGFEAAKQIRQFNKTIPIIALTAYTLTESKEKTLEAGFNDFLTKPVNRDILFQHVNAFLKY